MISPPMPSVSNIRMASVNSNMSDTRKTTPKNLPIFVSSKNDEMIKERTDIPPNSKIAKYIASVISDNKSISLYYISVFYSFGVSPFLLSYGLPTCAAQFWLSDRDHNSRLCKLLARLPRTRYAVKRSRKNLLQT